MRGNFRSLSTQVYNTCHETSWIETSEYSDLKTWQVFTLLSLAVLCNSSLWEKKQTSVFQWFLQIFFLFILIVFTHLQLMTK